MSVLTDTTLRFIRSRMRRSGRPTTKSAQPHDALQAAVAVDHVEVVGLVGGLTQGAQVVDGVVRGLVGPQGGDGGGHDPARRLVAVGEQWLDIGAGVHGVEHGLGHPGIESVEDVGGARRGRRAKRYDWGSGA